MDMVISRFGVYLVNLDPALGHEIKKMRPCIVISPDEANRYLRTAIIAPMTTTIRGYPTRLELTFQGKHGEIALDQMRAVDKTRLIKYLGKIDKRTQIRTMGVLQELFEL
jgi:mRNA interferase MazF